MKQGKTLAVIDCIREYFSVARNVPNVDWIALEMFDFGLDLYLEDHPDMKVARVYKLEDGGWTYTLHTSIKPKTVESLDKVPKKIQAHLAMLEMTDVGFRDETIGRKIADGVYWVFYK